jgi:hypothetical protein
MTGGDLGGLTPFSEQRQDDVWVEGHNGGGSLTVTPLASAAFYGPGFQGFATPVNGGNGHIEQAIVPPSNMVAAVTAQMADPGTSVPDHPRGRSIHERLGPRGNGFHHYHGLSGFHTPPELPLGASYGHAPSAPLLPSDATQPATFVPTSGGMAPGPQAHGGGPYV